MRETNVSSSKNKFMIRKIIIGMPTEKKDSCDHVSSEYTLMKNKLTVRKRVSVR